VGWCDLQAELGNFLSDELDLLLAAVSLLVVFRALVDVLLAILQHPINESGKPMSHGGSFLALRFRHTLLSAFIPILLGGNWDSLRPGDERFKKLSNGVKGLLQRGPCHQTSDRQYRSHADCRARSAISVVGLS
jgi:hypothetical protein